jgi:hypothetical protein
MGQSSFQTIPIAGRWHDVKHGIMLCDRIVMHHAVIRGFEESLVEDIALRIDFEE